MQHELIKYSSPRRNIYYHYRIFDGPQGSDMHFHNEIELIYYQTGSMKYIIDNIPIDLKEGELLFINSSVPHNSASCLGLNVYYILQFKNPLPVTSNLPYLASFLNDNNLPFYIFSKGDPVYEEIKDIIVSMREIYDRSDIASDFTIKSMQYRIVSLLYEKNIFREPTVANHSTTIQRLLPVFEYIEKNYEKTISLTTLANLINIERTYFCRLFKQTTGKNVSEYINYVRVIKAQELLKQGKCVTEVALDVGFSSVSHFGQVFKKVAFCSPSGFLKIIRSSANTPENERY